MSGWDEVKKWEAEQDRRRFDLNMELFKRGWLPVATNDGTYGARRQREGDPIEQMWWDGDPEANGHTPQMLLATIDALQQGRRCAK